MNKERIPETNTGITGEILVQDYDEFQKKLCDKGLLETKEVIKAGIVGGNVLEIGPGPGYLGLEWLKANPDATLYWLEISQDMLLLSQDNAEKYGLKNKILPHLGNATQKFPFNNEHFDGVFTSSSLHEWEYPVKVLNEMERVLKNEGNFFIGDLKRNTNPLIKFIMKRNLNNKAMKQGLDSSVNAAYLKNEVLSLLEKSNFKKYNVKENLFGLSVFGMKV
ncbi:MAG: class I SAM-dependent methyltransferase [Deltaproteobacteria bacterium]|nr:class I SAM-dependent methyltransferase [Deltaproteobacteria bacterium]